MPQLSLGKLRALQQLSDRNGVFAITALDHRGTFVRMIEGAIGRTPGWTEVVAEKRRVAAALLPMSTAVLVDPLYGGPLIADGTIPGDIGIITAREHSGPDGPPTRRQTVLQPGWGGAQIARLGASAVKLLMFYNPKSDVCPAQEQVVAEVAEECRQHELALILEPIAYPIEDGQERTDPAFAEALPEIVVETARRLVPLGVDLLKAEYPVIPGTADEETRAAEACRQITAAVDVPWVLLSGGVDFPAFQAQLEMACDAGASGFLAGRAIWKEAFTIADAGARSAFIERIGVSRMEVLNSVTRHRATPWFDRVPEANRPHPVEGWREAV